MTDEDPLTAFENEIRSDESKRWRKMFRMLHGVEPTKEHHPVGAYYPVGQLDGDCSCGNGVWPCNTLKESSHD